MVASWVTLLIVGSLPAASPAGAIPLFPGVAFAPAALGCRVAHEVEDPATFAAVVAGQRDAHLATSFNQDSIFRRLATDNFEAPAVLGDFVQQPVSIGVLGPDNEYGYRFHPIYRRVRFHNGLDIAGPSGTPVAALAAGTVVISDYRSGYGHVVVVDHDDGFSTLSAHLSVRSVTVGDVVLAGETVGAIGSSGTATGPHLHFETRLGGVPVNPRWFIPLLANPAAPTGSTRAPAAPIVPGGEGSSLQIERLYLTAFNRRPSLQELSYWVGRCEVGVPLETIAQIVASTPTAIARLGPLAGSELLELSEGGTGHEKLAAELLDPMVRRLFLALLGREPDVSGSYYWSRQVVAGESASSLAAAIGSSPEYQDRFGDLGDDVFVTRIYELVLGRQPDEAGLAYWLGRVSADSRWSVLVGFTESAEGRARLS
jgi:hypothetical protein